MIKVVLTRNDLVNIKQKIVDEQSILGLLKERGAPVVGSIWLQVKPGLRIISYSDSFTGDITYEFHDMWTELL